ncbi:C2 domain-containing protein 5-like [Sycon ciliatum]|uniref:C2 domain-containing protein 5-like n=1 Tax=Sycon ciliatum TaxID=27933 RepID=UPI0031F6E443
MPCTVIIRVPEARNLPVMDRQSESTDAFVEVRLGKDENLRRSEVCRHSLNPVWESLEGFVFEVDDDELQNEPLQVRVIDHDKISAHDVIGRVYISLGPLLLSNAQSLPPFLDGWFPIYDTLRGVRGEVRIVVRLDVLVDANRYRQSSTGVTFCAASSLPSGYAVRLHGFVEELVFNDDPEHQWIDNIRSKRKSNEERQSLLQKLACSLQRKVGVKVQEAGANSVLGYRQCIDLEGESGIVLRCVGTMAQVDFATVGTPPMDSSMTDRPYTLNCTAASDSFHAISPAGITKEPLRRGYDSLPHTPSEVTFHGNLSGQISSSFSEEDLCHAVAQADGTAVATAVPRRTSVKPAWLKAPGQRQATEFPFFTVDSLPPGVLKHIAGMVVCRSVELLTDITDDDKIIRVHDDWWHKVRREVMSHAHSCGCNAIVGYEETVAIDGEDVVLLSASGTAAIVQLNCVSTPSFKSQESNAAEGATTAAMLTTSAPTSVGGAPPSGSATTVTTAAAAPHTSVGGDDRHAQHQQLTNLYRHQSSGVVPSAESCALLHVPAQRWSVLQHRQDQAKCSVCGLASVPSILLTSIEIPPELVVTGRSSIIQSHVCRVRKKVGGEAGAISASSVLPFIESNLHRQLLVKLQRNKMNAVFGLKTQLSISESYIIAVATGTAVRLAALPLAGETPSVPGAGPTATSTPFPNEEARADGSGNAQAAPAASGTDSSHQHPQRRPSLVSIDHQDSRGERLAAFGEGKGMSFLELDDGTSEEDGMPSLNDLYESADILCSSLQAVPGSPFLPSQALHSHQLCVVHRVSVDKPSSVMAQLNRCMYNALARLFYRASRMQQCCICKLDFDVKQFEEGEDLQVTARANVMAYATHSHSRSIAEVEHVPVAAMSSTTSAAPASAAAAAVATGVPAPAVPVAAVAATSAVVAVQSPARPIPAAARLSSSQRPPHIGRARAPLSSSSLSTALNRVLISSCDIVPGYQLLQHLGHVSIFLVRESTSLREDHGSLGGMLYEFLVDAQAVARSHVRARGGNALLSFHVEISELEENSNQGQCLLAVSGDAVLLASIDRDTAV